MKLEVKPGAEHQLSRVKSVTDVVGVKNGYDGITIRKFSEIVFPKEIVKRRIQLS